MTSPSDDKSAKKAGAPALVRGLRVLELVSGSKERHNLTTIASEMRIAMSSAHSICTTLVNQGYLERATDGTFGLTLKVLDLASSKISNYKIVEHFYSVCDEIPLIRDNGATMSILDGADVYYIAARNSPHPLGVTFRTGARLPACCTASGRALLANLTNEEVCKLYPDELIPQLTKQHPKYRGELLAILDQARAEGYSREIKGTRPHMCSYGALVASPSGKAIAGVAITMYEGDLNAETEAAAINSIRLLADRLARFGDILH